MDRLRGIVPLVVTIILMIYTFYSLQPVYSEDTHTVEDTIIWCNVVSYGKGSRALELHSHDETYRVLNVHSMDFSKLEEDLYVDNLTLTLTVQDNHITIQDLIFWNGENDIVDIRNGETIYYDVKYHNERLKRTRVVSIIFFAMLILGSLVWLVTCIDELRNWFLEVLLPLFKRKDRSHR
ncbi:MAG: hypothetical protein IJ275_03950 [Ruminococcus sp.]|nr:hypothetical protein [Ruminococcus sp.]